MANVFSLIANDHQEILSLLRQLTGSSGRDLAPFPGRKTLVERLVMAESCHEAAEAQFLWPAVRDAVASGGSLCNAGLRQESTARRLLHTLERVDASSDDLPRLLARTVTDLRHHIAYEEEDVLPELRRALSTEDADRLGELITPARAKGPTRPHPHTPPIPGLLKSAGRAAMMTDRIRDFFERRGR